MEGRVFVSTTPNHITCKKRCKLTHLELKNDAVPYFPPEIQYLPILICILSPTATTPFHPVISDATSWELRSILLTWLSLLLTVPFNLSAFDEPLATAQVRRALPSHLTVPREPFPKLASGSTIHRLLHLLIPLLDSPSSEGSTAALVLARLFARGDGVDMLEEFFNWVGREVDGIEGRENGILVGISFHSDQGSSSLKLML